MFSMVPMNEAFAAFDIEGVGLAYSIASGEGTTARENIVTSKGLPLAAATMELSA
jgi:hypothetical protein